MRKDSFHGISKVLIAKKNSDNTYDAPIEIDGTNANENGIAELILNITQNMTKVNAGMKVNAIEKRSPLTATGTIAFANISREVRKTLQDLVVNSNGGVSSGSMFGKRSRFGLTIIQQDGELIAGKTYFDVGFTVQSTDTYQSISTDAADSNPLTLNIDAETIIVRKADFSLQDYFDNEFNSIDDESYIDALISKIEIPSTDSEEL